MIIVPKPLQPVNGRVEMLWPNGRKVWIQADEFGSVAQSQQSKCSLSSYVAVEWTLRLHNLWLAWMLGCPRGKGH